MKAHAPLCLCVALLALTGCDRGPKPAPLDEVEPPAAASAPATPAANPSTANPHAAGANPHAAGGAGASRTAAGGVAWQPPSAFRSVQPSSGMRAAEYHYGEGAEQAVLTVYHFPGTGGSVDDNVQRWVAQFSQPDGRPSRDAAKIEKKTVANLNVTLIDVTGTYQPMTMPGQMPQRPLGEQRLLGAIIEGPNGPVFFKMTGPAATVAKAEGPFQELVASVHAS